MIEPTRETYLERVKGEIPMQKKRVKKKLMIRQVLGLMAIALSLTLLSGTGWAQPLSAFTVPQPVFLSNFVLDEVAAIQLGKALFWDMQVGSDGVQACATCHFHAGADNRTRNQMNPDILGGSVTFSSPDRPNSTLTRANFPFFKPVDPDTDAPLARPFNHDVASSQGIRLTQFVDIKLGSAVDIGTPLIDPIWSLNLRGKRVNVRRVEPRNTPTVINAAFNFANFWDGRANNIFNGVNPFGPADANAKVFEDNGTGLTPATVRLENASLASQAVGPPLSDFEMSFRGRTFPKLGKKMLSLLPLAKQVVHPQDSVLGPLANLVPPNKGLLPTTSYTALIQAAFQPQYWNNTTQMVTYAPDGTATISPRPPGPLTTDQFTQMEANFSLFFGLAVQLYEATLISGESPFDLFLGGAANLTAAQTRGLATFNLVGCAGCHALPISTQAATPLVNGNALVGFPPQFLPPDAAIELMPTADRLVAFYDAGWNNISVVPTQNDPGRFGTAPFINPSPLVPPGTQYPLDYSRLSMLLRDGKIPPSYNSPPTGAQASYVAGFIPPLPIGNTQPPDRIGNHGAFKVAQLRNVELTGPYMHNGGMATLRQVVDFYTRGGNFDINNLADLDPAITPIGSMLGAGGALVKNDLVAFLLALTDNRVRNEIEPFDHPELFVPHGTTTTGVEITFRVPQVGRDGRAASSLPPLRPFLNVNQLTP
jgi:cytochrome c peroxidase